MTRDPDNLRRIGVTALFWALLQNWGGRTLATIVFVVLARLLQPEQFGLASSAFLVMSFLSLLAEFGFGDALVQKRDLKPADANLPFYVSLALATVLAVVAAIFSRTIASLLGVAGLAPYLAAAAALSPLVVLVGFQDAMYRRSLMFRQLAIRTLVGVVAGGLAGVGLAWCGFGTWALIAQFAVQTVASLVWLWSRPVWRPSLKVDIASFNGLGRFARNVVGMRVVDFVTLRSVDVIILTVYGPAALGLFAVSSRLYQLLMQLFQASVSSVGLSVISRVADDRARVARLFERSTSISAMAGMPVFFGLAALAPEVNLVMFGARWDGADQVMRPLLLVGGIHCVQFTMGSYLTALSRPDSLFRLMLIKALFVIPPVYLFRMDTVAALSMLYAGALLAETPFICHATLRSLGLTWAALVRPVGLPLLACSLAFAMVALCRLVPVLPSAAFGRAALLATVFIMTYAGLLRWLALKALVDNVTFLHRALR